MTGSLWQVVWQVGRLLRSQWNYYVYLSGWSQEKRAHTRQFNRGNVITKVWEELKIQTVDSGASWIGNNPKSRPKARKTKKAGGVSRAQEPGLPACHHSQALEPVYASAFPSSVSGSYQRQPWSLLSSSLFQVPDSHLGSVILSLWMISGSFSQGWKPDCHEWNWSCR